MSLVELVEINLLSPVVLAFVLGCIATLVRSDLKFPDELYVALSIYLLLAIGLKGGVELREAALADVWRPALATIFIGCAIPLWCIVILRHIGGFNMPDAAALAAHYGSCSAVTFIASITFLQYANVPFEGFMPTLVALMEVPAIVVALVVARRSLGGSGGWGEVLHEVFAGRSVLLLLGGIAIGFAAGRGGFEQVTHFFVSPFKGILMLFLLELGMIAARRFRDLKRAGLFLLAFAIIMPLLHGAIGVGLGKLTGLSAGGATILAVLCSSASYIAAPAAVRIALPEANPGYYLTGALAITFPFNLTIGIPLYYGMAKMAYSL